MATFRTVAQLRDTTTEEMLAGLIDAVRYNDEFTAILVANAMITDKPQIKLNRVASRSAASVVGCDDSITSVAVSGSAVTFDYDTLVSQFEVCKTGQNLYSSYTDVVESELAEASKRISRAIANNCIQGGTSMTGIEGAGGASTAIAGGSLDLSDLDVLFDSVLAKSPNMVLVAAPNARRAILRELRQASGGLTYDVLAGTAFKVPSYLGVPIVVSEFADSGKAHLVNLDEGYKLAFGDFSDNNYGIFGLQNVGPMETKLRDMYRLYAHVFGVAMNPQGTGTLTGIV